MQPKAQVVVVVVVVIVVVGITVKVPGTPHFLVSFSSHTREWNQNLWRHNDMLIIEGGFFFLKWK